MPSPRFALLAIGLLVAACDTVPEPDPPPPVALTVLNRTLSRGADLATALDGPGDLAVKAFQLYGSIAASSFSERASRLAQEIESRDPDVVALQEVLTVRTQYPSDAAGAPATPNASRVTYDYLGTLLDSLAARGARYRVASEAETWDVELAAMRHGGVPFDVRFTERAVLLVRDTLSTAPGPTVQADGAAFPDAPGLREPVGAATARVTVGASTVTVASARFGTAPDAAAAFARRLLDAVGPGPLAVLGSTPDAGSATTLAAISRVGLADIWAERGDGPPETCCLGNDFEVREATFDRRTDAIWTRDGRAQTVDRFSGTPSARTASGFWPSARAGLFARVILGGAPAS